MTMTKYKVYNSAGEHIASCKHATDAVWLVSSYGAGGSVRLGRAKKSILFIEGAPVFRVEKITGENEGGIRFHAPQDMHPRLVEILERNAIDETGRAWGGLSPDAVSEFIFAQEDRYLQKLPSWTLSNLTG